MDKKTEIAGLVERFSDLPDPRVEGRTDHDLLDIVVLALCAVMSGAEGWDDIEDWGREREAWLRRYLRLRNGIPGSRHHPQSLWRLCRRWSWNCALKPGWEKSALRCKGESSRSTAKRCADLSGPGAACEPCTKSQLMPPSTD
ncbi:MAG: transposase family protein [Uliginosibacterium sp.]|nr:transposase family protein [Uliginosibacterium sp.]